MQQCCYKLRRLYVTDISCLSVFTYGSGLLFGIFLLLTPCPSRWRQTLEFMDHDYDCLHQVRYSRHGRNRLFLSQKDQDNETVRITTLKWNGKVAESSLWLPRTNHAMGLGGSMKSSNLKFWQDEIQVVRLPLGIEAYPQKEPPL